jgi:peroxiredoxin
VKQGGQVVAISTDDLDTLRRFKAETKAPYPLLSDRDGKVVAAWSGKTMGLNYARRANFVVGKDGRITGITEGNDAIDPDAAVAACSAQ